MKNLLLTLFFFSVLTSNLPAQWQQIQISPLPTSGYCIDAIGNDFAVVGLSTYTIGITTDAGKTWTQKYFPTNFVVDISLVTKTVFYAAADDGTFYKTTNGGDSWEIIYSNPQKTSFGNFIKMFSSADGIAMGDANFNTKVPLFLKTTDGINWFETCQQPIGGGAADVWKSLDFVNSNIGYYSPRGGSSPRKLYKTTDGGINWIETNFDINANVLKFYNSDFGLLANLPTIYRTTNGGITWKDYPVQVMSPHFAADIEFVPNNPDKIWMSYNNGLFFSGDSGKTWTEQRIPNITSALDIVFTNEKTGWLLCANGNLFYTNNCGGLITNLAEVKTLPACFELSQNYPNPFNPETTIRYQISKLSFVTLKIYDLLGSEAATLVNKFQQPGIYNTEFSMQKYSLSSGIYFYRLTAGNFSTTRKMVLLK